MSGAIPKYLSAQEIAELKLDGLPTTKRRINAAAAKQNWAFVDRPGRGGGRLYSVQCLPRTARADLQNRRRAINENIRDRGRPKGRNFFTDNPILADAVQAILASRKLSAPRVMELLAPQFDELPSLRSLQRFISSVEKEKRAALTSIRNPDEYKGRYRVALGSADGGVTYAHEVWELDTTKADVLTKGGRMMVLGLIDRWSRRSRFLVVPSESAQSVRRLLVDTIRAWGVMPAAVATDNGSGFINASIVSALEVMGIEHIICPPGSPEKKPFVERLFGTFTRERAELLGGYAGHNVAEAQALRARARKESGYPVVVPEMTAEELQDVLTAWTEGVYHQRPHSALRMTPMRKWMSSPQAAAAAPTEDVLRIALSALVGTRRVGKRGIQWKRGRYWCAALAEYMGRDVMVRRDEDELGELFIFDDEGRFIDTAINAERAGMSEEMFARAARRQQDEFMNRARAELREKKRNFKFEDARDLLLRQDAERAGKLTALPSPTEERRNAAIDSIASGPTPQLPEQAKLQEAMDQAAASTQQTRRTPKQKMVEADEVMAAAQRGQGVDTDKLRWARAYSQSSEYRAEKMVSAHFQKSSPDTPSATRSAEKAG